MTSSMLVKPLFHICDEALVEATSPSRFWRIDSPCRACLEEARLGPDAARPQAA